MKIWKPTQKKSLHTTLTPQCQMDMWQVKQLTGLYYDSETIALALRMVVWLAENMPNVFELIDIEQENDSDE